MNPFEQLFVVFPTDGILVHKKLWPTARFMLKDLGRIEQLALKTAQDCQQLRFEVYVLLFSFGAPQRGPTTTYEKKNRSPLLCNFLQKIKNVLGSIDRVNSKHHLFSKISS